MIPALRSDHAGEAGAVAIYRGILALSRDDSVREFAQHHLATEERHLEIMEQLVPSTHRSRLLGVWRIAGWITGALPALFGASAVYRTIDAVETFVELHYSEQIERLRERPEDRELCSLLEQCCADEVMHRNEARSQLAAPGLIGRCWAAMVGLGSRVGVYLACRI